MSRIIFLLEERSMKTLLDGLLPRLIPGIPFLCVTHEGKQDLEKSIPRKLRAWREPGVRFVVLRDKDAEDCHLLKDRLVSLCEAGGHARSLVRIACQEIEAWYLGEPAAIWEGIREQTAPENRFQSTLPRSRHGGSALGRDREVSARISKGVRCPAHGTHLSPNGNRSRSFQVLMDGIEREACGSWVSRPSTGDKHNGHHQPRSRRQGDGTPQGRAGALRRAGVQEHVQGPGRRRGHAIPRRGSPEREEADRRARTWRRCSSSCGNPGTTCSA